LPLPYPILQQPNHKSKVTHTYHPLRLVSMVIPNLTFLFSLLPSSFFFLSSFLLTPIPLIFCCTYIQILLHDVEKQLPSHQPQARQPNPVQVTYYLLISASYSFIFFPVQTTMDKKRGGWRWPAQPSSMSENSKKTVTNKK